MARAQIPAPTIESDWPPDSLFRTVEAIRQWIRQQDKASRDAVVSGARALISSAAGAPAASSVTAEELAFLSGVTSAVQAQLDAKLTITELLAKILLVDGPSSGIDADKLDGRELIHIFPWNHIGGLGLSTAGGSTTLTIAAGACADSTNAQMLRLSASMTKVLSATGGWAGSTGGVGNISNSATATWYHVFAIGKSTDPTEFDIGFDTSVTAANLMSAAQAPGSQGFDLYRRIGSVKSDGSKNITLFYQRGDLFEWAVAVEDISNVSPTTATLRTLASVPLGIVVEAWGRVNFGGNGTLQSRVLHWNPALGAGLPAARGDLVGDISTSAWKGGWVKCLTNTSQQIYNAVVAGGGDAALLYYFSTAGWVDSRGKHDGT